MIIGQAKRSAPRPWAAAGTALSAIQAEARAAFAGAEAPDGIVRHLCGAMLVATGCDFIILAERQPWPDHTRKCLTTMLADGAGGARLIEDRGSETDLAWRSSAEDAAFAELVRSSRYWAAAQARIEPPAYPGRDAAMPFRHLRTLSLRAGPDVAAVLCLGRRDGEFCEDAALVFEGMHATLCAALLAAHERRARAGSLRAEAVAGDLADLRLIDAVAGLTEGFVRLDRDFRILFCNESFRRMQAVSGHLLTEGACFADCLRYGAAHGQFPGAEARIEDFVAEMLAPFRAKTVFRKEVALGSGRWVLVSHTGTADGCGVGIWIDVTEQKQREADLRAAQGNLEQKQGEITQLAIAFANQARLDRLTALPNRFAFEETLAAAFRETRIEGRSHVLLYLDLDQFKIVNDTCGHAAGDRLLREIAALIKEQVTGDHFVARLGGDEFVVILRDVDEAAAGAIAENLCRAVQAYRFPCEGRVFTVGLSVGLAALGEGTVDMSGALAQADAACYAAKGSGGGRVHAFQACDKDLLAERELYSAAQGIRQALIEGRLQVWLQRIVDCDGALLGHEALVRMLDESGRILAPAAFLPAAKRFGMMAKVDQWICCEAVRLLEAARRSPEGSNLGFVSVNLSPKSVGDSMFRQWFFATVDQVRWIKDQLRIEITESDQLQWTPEILDFFKEIRRRGIKLYLDDFGSGYNSFDLIKKVPIDGIKIDAAVSRDILADAIDLALVKAAVSIAGSLDFELVAEGVETPAVLDRLAELGVRAFQGVHFHHPEPFEAARTRPARTGRA